MNLKLHSRHGGKRRACHQLLLVMKLIVLLLTTAILQVSASTFAQKITLNKTKVPLGQIINEIRNQSGYDFLYNNRLLKETNPVTINVKDASIDEVLAICFKNQPLTYKLEDKAVLLKEKEKGIIEKIVAYFTNIDIYGKVVDEKNEPLAGATIKVKGTAILTNANEKGEFSLKNIGEKSILEVSYTGYITKEITASENRLTVVLAVNNSTLDEVQIIGYGTTTRRLTTGSIASINASDIEKQPVSNPLAALSGRMSGVLIAQNNGVPGGAVQVQIRGQNSLSQGNMPLYIIDGVPFTNFNGGTISDYLNANGILGANGGISPFGLINPSDIERIDVLKDADATSIYGSRGANGVILITTKKGKSGPTKVGVNLNSGFTEVNRFIPMLNLQQYLALRTEAFKNDGVTPTVTNAPDLTLWDQNSSTDWQKMLIGNTGHLTDVQSSLSGGNEQTRFFFNSAYRRESTVFPGEYSDKRFSARLNLDHTSVNKKFNASFSVNYTINNSNIPISDLAALYNLPPNYPLYDAAGKIYWLNGAGFTNPMAFLLRENKSVSNNLIANAILRYTILPGLTAKANLGYTNTRLDQNSATPASSLDPATSPTNSAEFANSNAQNWIIEPTVDYVKSIGRGRLLALVGASFQKNTANAIRLSGLNYSSVALLHTLAAAGSTTTRYNDIVQYKYNAVFAKLNYDWSEKYLFNATFRRDGSSRFGPNNRFGNFGAVGAGWVFSKEDFIKNNLGFLSFGKLRTSFGTSGNDQITNYLYLSLYSTAPVYLGSSAVNTGVIPNENLQWETTKKLEFAIDLGFLKDRILFTTNYYRNRSSNQITSNAIANQSGFTSYLINLPALIQNKGFEFELNTINIMAKDFSWKTSLNVTFTSNKLLDFPNLDKTFSPAAYTIGESITPFRIYHYLGVNPANGTALFEDRDGNGSITSADRYVAKMHAPFFGGFNNTFSYKNFELGVFFQFNHRYGVTKILNTRPGVLINQNEDWLNRWSPTNTSSDVPGATATPGSAIYTSYNNYALSDAVYGDASFLKLRSANLSYRFTSEWLKRIKLSSLNVFIQSQNLYTWSKNKYILDTETQVQGPAGLGTGTIGQVLPPLRTVVFGFNCTL